VSLTGAVRAVGHMDQRLKEGGQARFHAGGRPCCLRSGPGASGDAPHACLPAA
jgi:hypothetical protein